MSDNGPGAALFCQDLHVIPGLEGALRFLSRRMGYGLSAVVVAAAEFNALGLWGVATALRGQFVLEVTLCVVALLAGLLVVRRVAGLARWWRVTLLAAIATFLAAEALSQRVGWLIAARPRRRQRSSAISLPGCCSVRRYFCWFGRATARRRERGCGDGSA